MNLPQEQPNFYYICSVSIFVHALTQAIRLALYCKTLFITPYFSVSSYTNLNETLEPIWR